MDLDAIAVNVTELKRRAQRPLMAVVKADGVRARPGAQCSGGHSRRLGHAGCDGHGDKWRARTPRPDADNWRVYGSGTVCLALARDDPGVDPPVGAGRLIVEGQGIEGGLGPLETVLAAGALSAGGGR